MSEGTEQLHRMAIFMNAEFVSNKTHDAILQTLNREIGGYYFSIEAFQNSVAEWQDIPVIYASDHPDMKLFSENPTLALDKVKGRIVGSVQVPNIETVGHPRLMGNLEIVDEEVNKLIDDGKISHSTGFFGLVNEQKQVTEVTPNHVLVFQEDANNLPKDRGAFILNKETEPYGDVKYADPGYQEDGVKRYPLDTEAHVRAAWSYINMPKNAKKYSADQLSKIKAKIKAAAKKFGIEIKNMETDGEMANKDTKEFSKEDVDAMLDFMKDNPGMMDKGTMDKMYTAMDKANQKEYMKSVLNDLNSHPEMMDDDMKSMIKGMMNKEISEMGKEEELAKQLEISNKEKEAALAEKATLEAKVKAFEQKETERKKAERETQWQAIKKSIPVGLTHKAEDEAKLRAEFEADPYAFAVKLTEFKQKQGTQEEGKEFANANLTDEQKEEKEDEIAYEELRARRTFLPHRRE